MVCESDKMFNDLGAFAAVNLQVLSALRQLGKETRQQLMAAEKKASELK